MRAKAPPASLAAIAAALREARSVVVLSHVNPDGDAIGSQVGLGLALQAMGKPVTLLNEDGCPENYAFLPGTGNVQRPGKEPVDAAVVVALDTATRERLGKEVLAQLGDAPRLWINIDHHVSNPGYGDMVHVDPSVPATGQLVYELLEQGALPMPMEVLENLFVAISTDTGSFQYPCTTARTFHIAAAMVGAGLDVGALSSRTYHRRPLRKVRLLQRLLGSLQLHDNGRVASCQLDLATKQELGIQPGDSEELINEIRAIDTVLVAVFFEELADGKIRVSSRSKDSAIDVCRICAQFGGGGHPQAAGARMPGPLAEARDRFLSAVHEATSILQP